MFSSRRLLLAATSPFRFRPLSSYLNLSFSPTPTRFFSSPIVQHRDTPESNPSLQWDFTPSNYVKVKKILSKFPSNYKSSAVMPLLTLAQEQNDNWLPISAMHKVAEICEMPAIRVYEVATFYSMYNRERMGKYHIQLCGTTPCQLCGAEKLAATLESHLGVPAGETSSDGLFVWTEVECLGACANAPMIQINNHEFYENLTSESLIKLLNDLKEDKKVQVGPQNGQRVAEGPLGQTTLKGEPAGPFCRDMEEEAKKWKAELEKQKAAAEAAKAAAAAQAAAVAKAAPPPK